MIVRGRTGEREGDPVRTGSNHIADETHNFSNHQDYGGKEALVNSIFYQSMGRARL